MTLTSKLLRIGKPVGISEPFASTVKILSWQSHYQTPVCTNRVWFWLRQLRGLGASPQNPRSASHKFSRICTNQIVRIQGFVKIRENSWLAEQPSAGGKFGGFAPKPLFGLPRIFTNRIVGFQEFVKIRENSWLAEQPSGGGKFGG